MARMTLNQAERRELISSMVTNCAGWDKEDLDILHNMSDDKLWVHARGCAQLIANEEEDAGDLSDEIEPSAATELESSATEGLEDEEVDGNQGEQGPPAVEPDAETKDQPKKCWDEEGNETSCPEETADGENVTENQYLNFLPPRIRSVVVNAIKFEQAQKAQLVGSITANSRNRFSSQYLMRMSLDELQALADLASPRRSNQLYVGAAGGPVLNQSDVDREDILTVPTLEFTMSSKG